MSLHKTHIINTDSTASSLLNIEARQQITSSDGSGLGKTSNGAVAPSEQYWTAEPCVAGTRNSWSNASCRRKKSPPTPGYLGTMRQRLAAASTSDPWGSTRHFPTRCLPAQRGLQPQGLSGWQSLRTRSALKAAFISSFPWGHSKYCGIRFI